VELSSAENNPSILVVRRFLTESKHELLTLPWGSSLFDPEKAATIWVWIRLPRIPVLPPWQTPYTWGDARKICHNQGINLDQILHGLIRYLREPDCHLLIGFPFPSTIGGPDEQMHWQAIEFKARDALTGSYPGFRTGRKEAIWKELRRNLIHEGSRIMWKESQNWASKELVSRGSLPAQLAERKVLLIGGGTLGSAIAELLLRAGVQHMTIVDGQDLRAGNLCRHTLGIEDLEKNKAEGLVKRLGGASPHGVLEAIPSEFPPTKAEEIAKVQDCELIIDCTAEDDVLYAMSAFPWNGQKIFASFSLSFAARRLFCFMEEGSRFPVQRFNQLMLPWLKRDEFERGNVELPREGLGCWHPVFPARIDDVWMLAAIAVKQLAMSTQSSFVTTGLTVYEQAVENDTFVGVRRVSDGVNNGGSGILVEDSNVRPDDSGERDRCDGSEMQGR